MTTPCAVRKCWRGSLPAAIDGIPENMCSSRAFARLTEADILGKIVCAKTEALVEKSGA
jgi:hypothetical protein